MLPTFFSDIGLSSNRCPVVLQVSARLSSYLAPMAGLWGRFFCRLPIVSYPTPESGRCGDKQTCDDPKEVPDLSVQHLKQLPG